MEKKKVYYLSIIFLKFLRVKNPLDTQFYNLLTFISEEKYFRPKYAILVNFGITCKSVRYKKPCFQKVVFGLKKHSYYVAKA